LRTYGSPRVRFVVALLAATFFFTGCATLTQKAPDRKADESFTEAAALQASLGNVNKTLVTFKGIGTISMLQGERKQRFRAAWAAKAPDQLRIQLMGLAGQPVASIACDGSHYYFLTHNDGKLIKRRADASGFKKFINIPINAQDVFALFSGRPKPPNEGMMARMEKDESHEAVLVLWDTEEAFQDRIYLDPRRAAIRKVERSKDNGRLIWRAELDNPKKEDSYNISKRITLSTGEDVRVIIDTERFWANPDITSDLFVISSPLN